MKEHFRAIPDISGFILDLVVKKIINHISSADELMFHLACSSSVKTKITDILKKYWVMPPDCLYEETELIPS